MSGGHFHVISMGGLPEPIRALLEGSSDPQKEKMRHEIQARERADFWNSLDKVQLGYLLGILGGIAHADDEDVKMNAGRAFGIAEAYMMSKHNSCACGEVHRDPSSFMGDLMREADKAEEEKVEAKKLGLEKIEPNPFMDESNFGKFICVKCKTIFDTISDRRQAGVGSSHIGCDSE